MEPTEYEVLYRHEDGHWWYAGLHDLVLRHLAELAGRTARPRLLDAGCGTGKLLAACTRHQAVGIELAPEAFPFLRQRGLANLVRGTICRLPFPDDSFDAVVSLDVLYHIAAPGDLMALRELARVVRPGGQVLLNLPAYEFLRSRHDVAIHTQQRYTCRQVAALFRAAGLRIHRLSYRNTLLFPAAAAVRLVRRWLPSRGEPARSDLHLPPPWLNSLLTWPLLLENRLLQRGLRLPFGLSIFGVGVKTAE